METKTIAKVLAELGNSHRLGIFRLLVRHAGTGLTVGEIQAQTRLAASTLSFHLRGLVDAGLVEQEKIGRHVLCRPVVETVERAVAFLRDECCSAEIRTAA
ncbi:MAG TPA: helix-turn-helix transcriptional regulator [Allosphingosinicella sp.]|jgi:DNA-binding transcriptional ArsR family regulator